MNMRTTLILMAATTVPAFAQQPALPATQELAKMVAPAQLPAATPEQRAAVLSSLAVLPADVDSFFTITNIGGNVSRLANSGVIPTMRPYEIPNEVLALDGAALASSAANGESIAALSDILASVYTSIYTDALAGEWTRAASDQAADVIDETARRHVVAAMNAAVAKLPALRIHPTYGVITCKPGNEGMLQEWYAVALNKLQSGVGRSKGHGAVNDLNGFSGVKIDLSQNIDTTEPSGEYLEYVKDEPSFILGQAIRKEAATRTIYILLRQQGNALIAVVCEDPSEVKLAASPAESVLASALITEADANLNSGMIALGQLGTALVSDKGTPATIKGLGNAFGSIFTALGAKDSANKAVYDKAAAGVHTIASQLTACCRSASQPALMQCWCDKDIHFQLSGDAMGSSFTPAPLRHADKADAPGTILYAATTPIQSKAVWPSLPVIMDAALDITQGYSLTLPTRKRAKLSNGMAIVNEFIPEAKEMMHSIGTVCEGLDGSAAFVIDSSVAPMAPAFKLNNKTAAMPRVAASFGVSDRSKLGEGWDGIVSTSGKIIEKLGGDPASVGMLPIVPSKAGEVTSYTLSLPYFNADFVPTLAVSNSSLVVGSSQNLNQELASAATGTTDFAGAVFIFRPEPLADTLASLADALEEEKPVAPPTPIVVEDDDDDEEGDYDYEDDYEEYYDEEDYYSYQPRSTSDELRDVAEGLKECSQVVEAIYGTVSESNGRSTIRVDVKLR